MYWLFLFLSTFVDAKAFIAINPPVRNGLVSLIAMVLSLLIGLSFYIGMGMLCMSVFRFNQYYFLRGERIESILTLATIGVAFILISYIQPIVAV
jgi:hypothetical protein